MRVGAVTRSGNEVGFAVDADRSSYDVWFRFAGDVPPLDLSGSPALVATVIPALAAHEDLSVDGPVDERLLGNVATAQDVLIAWDRELHPRHPRFGRGRIEASVRAGVEKDVSEASRGTACFFSGGLDSFYSVVKHRSEITALVFAIGFDVMLDDVELAELVLPELRAAAAALELPPIEITTNLRGLGEHFRCGWGPDYHGSALGTLANLLSPQFSRVIVPSSRTYAHLEPWGSHVVLDPLWSTSRLEIVHDGAEATRVDKIRLIAPDEVATRFLRVCHHNYGLDVYNCGRCEKCVSTALSARAAGVAASFSTLPQPSAAAILGTSAAPGPTMHWKDTLQDLLRSGRDRQLQALIGMTVGWNTVAEPIRRARRRADWVLKNPGDVYRRVRGSRG